MALVLLGTRSQPCEKLEAILPKDVKITFKRETHYLQEIGMVYSYRGKNFGKSVVLELTDIRFIEDRIYVNDNLFQYLAGTFFQELINITRIVYAGDDL